jgi:hypothetical protein
LSAAYLLTSNLLLSSQVDKAAEHTRAINEGVVASITQFIGALSEITGKGRPHDKVRQSMQVRRFRHLWGGSSK